MSCETPSILNFADSKRYMEAASLCPSWELNLSNVSLTSYMYCSWVKEKSSMMYRHLSSNLDFFLGSEMAIFEKDFWADWYAWTLLNLMLSWESKLNSSDSFWMSTRKSERV